MKKVPLSLGFLIVGVWGCGVKTLPKSDALQLQPEIPFHETAPQAVSHKKKAATPKNPTGKEEVTDEPTQKVSDSNRRMDRNHNPL